MITRNQDGYAIVIAIMMLSIMTVIATAGLQMSITEQKIATNHLIHEMEFYGAESALAVGAEWCNEGILPIDDPAFDETAPIPDVSGTLSNQVSYTGEIEYVDALNIFHPDSKMPDIRITGSATHPRKGIAKVQQTFRHAPLFYPPEAALRVHSMVHGNGVSGSISGMDASGSGCDDVPGIAYDMLAIPPEVNVEYGGSLSGDPAEEYTGTLYPMSLYDNTIKAAATQKLTPDVDGKVAPGDIITSEAKPGVVVITGDVKITNLSGWGLLYVDGTFDAAGNLDWHGVIMTTNNLTFSGGGNKIIYGSVVSMGDALAINGSVDIQYDCEVIQNLLDSYSVYKPLPTWRQL